MWHLQDTFWKTHVEIGHKLAEASPKGLWALSAQPGASYSLALYLAAWASKKYDPTWKLWPRHHLCPLQVCSSQTQPPRTGTQRCSSTRLFGISAFEHPLLDITILNPLQASDAGRLPVITQQDHRYGWVIHVGCGSREPVLGTPGKPWHTVQCG